MEFIIAFLYRVISGAQNGAGYAQQATLRTILGGIMVGINIYLIATGFGREVPLWMIILHLVVSTIAIFGVIGVEDSFEEKWNFLTSDIHLYEVVATGCTMISLALLNYDLVLIACSVYPALILHKGFVNLGAGLSFFDKRTDDPTGKTFNIPLLNIKVPRASTRFRIIAAMVSIFVAVGFYIFGWSVQLYPFITLNF
jgi:hypothetical protein